MDIQKLLTIEEVAEILRIQKQTIYNRLWRETFPIPHKKIGNLIRFRQDDVQDFLNRAAGDA